ncbi:hypothetical protein [Nocardia asiatica]|uniref:hypothetical protein n=1 Tax=Nocardia asiatica TaxID=209252 RepID=UPI003EDFB6BE
MTHFARSLHSGASFVQLASETFDAEATHLNPQVGCSDAQPSAFATACPPNPNADAAIAIAAATPIRMNMTAPPIEMP